MKQIEVVAALIKQENKVLATQRGYGEWKDGWEFPGGKIEAEETPEAALRREILEELAVEVEVQSRLVTVEYDYPQFHLTMHCYWCRLLKGEPTLLEHEAAQWLTRDQLGSVDWLPADLEVVAAIKQA